MTATATAIQSYASNNKLSKTGKSYDAEVLLGIARQLLEVQNSGEMTGALDILHTNTMVWTVLQEHLSSNGNHLPDEVLANLISLSMFVDKHTTKITTDIENSTIEDLSVLININKNIALGLLGSPDSSS